MNTGSMRGEVLSWRAQARGRADHQVCIYREAAHAENENKYNNEMRRGRENEAIAVRERESPCCF